MGFLGNPFIKTSLVQRALNHTSVKMGVDRVTTEQVITNYFKSIKRLMIDREVDSIHIFGWGNFFKQLTKQEKALKQIKEENERRLTKMENDNR